MTNPVYAIGDLHGRVDEFERALSLIEQDGGPEAEIVFLGDYVDRGPDSRGVLDRLIAGRDAGKRWITLLGNHDRMFAWFMKDHPLNDMRLPIELHWLHERLGGMETLASYGIDVSPRHRLYQVHTDARAVIPREHLEFLRSLPVLHQTKALLFVHAGLRPGIPLEQQTEDDCLWIREEFLDDARSHPWLVVHGHTPVKRVAHFGNHVNLDSGAGYGRSVGVAVFEGRACWELTDKGRLPLQP